MVHASATPQRFRRPVLAAVSGAVLTAALMSALCGCASAAPGTGTASPSPLVVDSMDSMHPPWAAGMQVTEVTPNLSSEDAESLTSLPWRFVSLDAQRLLLIYAAGDGSCVLPRGFAVTYTKTSVEVWALSKTDTHQAACPARLEMGMAAVRLAEPLDGRALVHAPTDSQWPDSMLAG